MSIYTQQQLIQRDKILNSQILFGNYLNSDIVNNLINIFNNTDNTIVNYINNERKRRGLNTSNFTIKSELYGNAGNYNLFLNIFKNNVDFIHLTIHLCVHQIRPEDNGIIHIRKDIYLKTINGSIMSQKQIKNIFIHLFL